MNNALDFLNIVGSFGRLEGEVNERGNVRTTENESVKVTQKTETDQNGVSRIHTVVAKKGRGKVDLSTCKVRFWFDNGDIDVYTQSASWSNESAGKWEPLNTGVLVRNNSMRATSTASPMLAFRNRQNNKGYVFHLLTDCAWEISLTRYVDYVTGQSVKLLVELGFSSEHLRYPLTDKLALPDVLTYRFDNKTDLDAWKLHSYVNRRYPIQRNAVIYNSWMCDFDYFTVDSLNRQMDRAADLGADYFVLDAGWFGPKGRWTEVRGDWEEDPAGNLQGRMLEIAENVRAHGMKFGVWFEIETTASSSKSYAEHPEYYIRENNAILLDFSNPEAWDFIYAKTAKVIEKYGVEFIKFDYNTEQQFDRTGRDFRPFLEGYRRYLAALKKAYPGIYFECCASGGMRMDLNWFDYFDSFWPSDDHSLYDSTEQFHETMKRFPLNRVERWFTARSVENFHRDYNNNPDNSGRLITTDDSGWGLVRGVNYSYFDNFLSGGPIGISCDLNALSDKDYKFLRDEIAKYRREKDAINASVCRLLAQTETLTVWQYSDDGLTDIDVRVTTVRVRQRELTVYPVVDPRATYVVTGDGKSETRKGKEIAENGIRFLGLNNYVAKQILLKKV